MNLSASERVARAYEPILSRVERVVRTISALGIVLLMLGTALDVLSRTVTNRSIPGVVELTEVALVAVVYLGQMTTTWDGQHIRVTFITERLSIATARWLRIAVAFVCSGLLVWMIVATTTKAVTATEAGEYRFGLIPIPVWPARILIPVGLFAMLLLIILQLIQLVAKRTSVPGLLVDGMVESEGAVVPTVSTDVREQKEGSL